jgi:hypothetical protein
MNFVKVLITMYLRGSVNNEVRLQAGDAKGIENVAQYIIRNTFSLAKLSISKRPAQLFTVRR